MSGQRPSEIFEHHLRAVILSAAERSFQNDERFYRLHGRERQADRARKAAEAFKAVREGAASPAALRLARGSLSPSLMLCLIVAAVALVTSLAMFGARTWWSGSWDCAVIALTGAWLVADARRVS